MEPIHQTTAARTRAARTVAALLAALLAVTAGFVASGPVAPAGAAEPLPTGLTWKVSEYAFTSSSLAPAHQATAPATKTDDGWSFGTVEDAFVDPLTGAVGAGFPGGFELGNTNQGNYRIRMADLLLAIPAGRATGTISADVSYALTPAPGQPHSFTTPVRVVVADLTFPAGSITDTGSELSFTVTPDFVLRTDLTPETNPNGFKQFPQTLLDSLHSSLLGHVRQTNTGQDTKAPAPLSVSFPYTAEAPPTGLTWRMSQTAWTSSSLSPAHATAAPATKTDAGFSFPETSSAVYDPETGEGQIDFPGSFDLGNTSQGNYRIRVAEPSLVLPGDGTGELTADVSYALPPAAGQPHTFTTAVRVVVADLIFTEGAIQVDGDQLSFVVTPSFVLRSDLAPEANPGAWKQFPQPFLDALAPAQPSLLGHFRQTADGQTAKAPSPLGVNVTFETPEPPDPDATLVRLLYGVSMGRDAGETEIAYWVGRLDAGVTPRAVARAISTSPEARAFLVRAGYASAFDRTPAAAEVDYWVGRIKTGMTAEGLVVELLGSAEALQAWGGPEGLADAVYQFSLGGEGDSAGVAYWAARFEAAGTPTGRRAVVRSFYRLPVVTQHWVQSSLERSCGVGEADPADTAVLESAWAQTGRDPIQLGAATAAIVCPDRPLPE